MSTVKQDNRLGTIPTPRGSAEADPGLEQRTNLRPPSLPTQLSAPELERIGAEADPSSLSPERITPASAPSAPPRTARRRWFRVVAVGTVASLLVGGVMLSRADAEARSAEETRAQVQMAAADAIRISTRAWRARGATLTAVAAAHTIATAEATLAATPQAGDAPRAALQAAVAAARAALAGPSAATNARALAATVAAIDAPRQAAVKAQHEWQVAEDARIAAEKAAAEQAAAQAAAEQAAAQAAAARAAATRTTTTKKATTTTRTATSSGGTAAPAAPAPAVSMVGVEYSAATVGAALNAFRASQGLPPMAIVRSAARVQHASEMAASNSIWHSSVRTMWEIVGRVSPVSATAMINAYANSTSHREVMAGPYKTAYIGAVTYNGMLYTSIQCI